MVFEASSIFIATAANKKKKHFLQKCLQTSGCKQTEQYENHGNSLRLLPRYAKHKQQVVRRLQKDEHCFFFFNESFAKLIRRERTVYFARLRNRNLKQRQQ